MGAIFICYRRDDAEGEAGRLFDDLTAEFGADKIFMDVVDIEPGLDFRSVIDRNVSSCNVLLAVVAKGWIDAKDEAGHRRLDKPEDFVRIEIASALKRNIPVIPVLVHGAHTPRAAQLPDELKDLAYRNAVPLTHVRWDTDVQLLIKAIHRFVDSPVTVPPTQTAGQPSRTIIVAVVAAITIAAGGYGIYKHYEEKAAAKQAAMEKAAAAEKAAAEKAAAEKAAAEQAAAEKAAAEQAAAKKAAVEKAKQAAVKKVADQTAAEKAAADQAAADQVAENGPGIPISSAEAQSRLIHKVEPQYPPLALQNRTQGTVALRFVIDKDGKVQNPQVISGPKLLVGAAMDAVKQYRYKPYLLKGRPTAVTTDIKFNFTLP
jgi:TonB family protein